MTLLPRPPHGDGGQHFVDQPACLTEHPLLAVRTALRMREHLVAFNQDQERRGERTIRIGMGVHTGEVMAGNVGAEGRKTEYTIMGQAVNLASRLEGANKELGSSICIGPTAAARLDPRRIRSLGRYTVRGREDSLEVFTAV